MSKHILSGIVMGIALLAASTAAQASPINYTLSGVTFTDGTSATGSFYFDAVTHLSSSFSISTTAGVLSAFTFDKSDSGLYYGGGAGPNNFTIITTDGRRVFNFSFLTPFTDAGGNNAINISSTYECNNCGTFRRVNAGFVTSNAVPEPATSALMFSAVGALAVMRRRRKHAAA
jgi:hypothetical protein